MLRKVLMFAALSVLLSVSVPAPASADGSFTLGSIVCTKEGNENGPSYLIFSYQEVDCVYHGVGGPQKYDGVQGILLGVDVGERYQDIMTYEVVGGAWEAKAPLEGKYVGVQASATVGIGPTVQVGLVGVGNGLTLVPVGLGGGIGLGASGGLSYLTLTPVK
ncbi:MAG: DUF992 domain-containing protein [Alphaproteobacteria bacterium]|nr:DUF992 domain-containing protein [Alphaproteobacteria bacterium]MBF0128471.1 DUF992 domain-containing protein [Alphaproteobacteria bacterium]